MAREICLSLPVGKLEETGQRYLINVIRILRYINYRKKKSIFKGGQERKFVKPLRQRPISRTIFLEITQFQIGIQWNYSVQQQCSPGFGNTTMLSRFWKFILSYYDLKHLFDILTVVRIIARLMLAWTKRSQFTGFFLLHLYA